MATSTTLILFDMEGVLSHYDRDARTARLSAITGQPPERVRHAIWDSGLEARADGGEITDDEYLEELGVLLGRRVSRAEWLDSRLASITPNVEAIALAAKLAGRFRIAVLTNNCRLMTDHIAMLNPSVAQVFGRDVYSSASFGAAKPAAQSYLRCLGQLGIGAAQTLFIDDSAANVTGAIDAGLQGYRFVSTEALAAELARRQLI